MQRQIIILFLADSVANSVSISTIRLTRIVGGSGTKKCGEQLPITVLFIANI